MVGIFDRVCRQHRRNGNFLCSKSIDSQDDGFSQRLLRNPTLRALGTCGLNVRAGKDYCIEFSCHPLFPTSLLNYFLRPDTDSILGSYMFLGVDRQDAGVGFLYVFYVGDRSAQLGSPEIMRGEKLPANIEYWIWGGVFVDDYIGCLIVAGPDCISPLFRHRMPPTNSTDGRKDPRPAWEFNNLNFTDTQILT